MLSGFWLLIVFPVVLKETKAQGNEVIRSCAYYRAYKSAGTVSNPKFRIEQRGFSGDAKIVLTLHISMSPSDTSSEQALGNLACNLSKDFANHDVVNAFVFDDVKAAANILLNDTEQRSHGPYLWHLRAKIHLDRKKNNFALEFLMPELEDDLLTVVRSKVALTLDE